MRELVDVTPFTLLVAVFPAVVKELDEITLEVAVTPLIVVVKVLPASDVESELMKVVNPLVMPFTIVAKELVVVARVFRVMTLLVAAMPFTVLVKVLPAVPIVWVVRLLRDVVATCPCALVVRTPPPAPVMVRFEVVALVAVRLLKNPLTLLITDAMRFVADTPARVEVPETVWVPPIV
jgi:hypothetical protein